MPNPSFIRTMIEALRTKPNPERRVYKEGKLFRTEPVSQGGMNKKIQYDRYKKIQYDAGEDAVSYEDWMKEQ